MRTIWHGRRNRKLIQANNIPEIAEDIHSEYTDATVIASHCFNLG